MVVCFVRKPKKGLKNVRSYARTGEFFEPMRPEMRIYMDFSLEVADSTCVSEGNVHIAHDFTTG